MMRCGALQVQVLPPLPKMLSPLRGAFAFLWDEPGLNSQPRADPPPAESRRVSPKFFSQPLTSVGS